MNNTNININALAGYTPVEIDTEYLRQESVKWHNLQRMEQNANSLRYEAFNANRSIWCYGKSDVFGRDTYNVIATGEQVSREELQNAMREQVAINSYARGYQQRYEEASALFTAAAAAVDLMHSEWIRRGCWSRYWLVVSSSGHIHRDTECHTCNKGKNPTSFALYARLSGLTTADAVAKLGAALCSFCFPEAPVEHREQVKISKAATVKLLETGDVAEFDKAIAKQKKNDAAKCPGSNVEGTRHKDGSRFIKCSCCDFVGMLNWNSQTEKLPRHKPYYNKATQIQDKGSPS